MTYLWSGMIIIGIVYGALTGNLKSVTEAAVSSGKDAVTLCISMAGIVAMWSGLMKIAETSGMVERLSGKMCPVMRFLFPDLDPDSKPCKYISLNFLSNILGLGWAATPAGLKAMESLAELNELDDKRNVGYETEDTENRQPVQDVYARKQPAQGEFGKRQTAKGQVANGQFAKKESGKGKVRIASKEMCTFLIINVSSLQLIPVNMIAYRSQYGSADPAAIVGPGIAATAVSTAVAVVFCRVMNRTGRAG